MGLILFLIVLATCVGYMAGAGAGSHQRTPPGASPPAPPKRTAEPWESAFPTATLIPVITLQIIAQPDDLVRARRDRDRVASINDQIASAGGLTTPLEVVVDRQGRVVLGDGHHRLVNATNTGRATMPVTFTMVSKIGGFGRPITALLNGLAAPTRNVPTPEARSSSRAGASAAPRS